jgi:hypothetical protein
MKKEIHGINCECCESKSPEAKQILEEIRKILDPSGTGIESEKEQILKKFDQVVDQFTRTVSADDYNKVEINADGSEYRPYEAIPEDERFVGSVDANGGLASLRKIVDEVFSLPDGDLNFELLKIDDPNKEVGGLKVTEITDHPGIDVSKLVDFDSINMGPIQNLKISIISKTIEATIGMKFGPVSLGLLFKIGGGDVAWAPAFSVKTNEEALDRLKGSTYKKTLTPSGPEGLDELKALAKEQFASPENSYVKEMLELATDKENFFETAELLKVNIQKDVDVAKEMADMVKAVESVKEIEKLSSVPANGDPDLVIIPEKAVPSDIGKVIGKCAERVPSPAPYRPEEIQKVHDQNCKNWKAPGRVLVKDPGEQSGPETKTVSVDIKIAGSGDVVSAFAREKGDLAPLAEDAALTAKFNDIGDAPDQDGFIAIDFVKNPIDSGLLQSDAGSTLNIPDVSLPNQAEAIGELEKFMEGLQKITNEMQSCAKTKSDASDRWWGFFEHTFQHRITTRYFDLLRDNLENYYGELQSILIQRDSALKQLALTQISEREITTNREKFETLIEETLYTPGANGESIDPNYIAAFSNGILSAEERNYQLSILEETRDSFNEFVEILGQIGNQDLSSIRQSLQSSNNPLTNTVGFPPASNALTNIWWPPNYASLVSSQNLFWTVMVKGNIADRCKELWTQASTTSSRTLQIPVDGVTTPLTPYIVPISLPYYTSEGNIIQNRTGLFETGVWNKFYSAQRINAFFTYQEQGYNQQPPQYDDRGNLIGEKIQKIVKNGLEEDVIIESPAAAEGLEVDDAVATAFLENMDANLRIRVEQAALNIEASTAYSNYVNNVLNDAAQKEAAKVFFEELQNRNFLDGPRNIFAINSINDFRRKSFVCEKYTELILQELIDLEITMQNAQACVDQKEKDIEEEAKRNLTSVDEGGSQNQSLEAQCKQLLGSDPVGQRPPSGKCPSYTKNCYWKEYTKIMQKVSLLPVIELDPPNMSQRLFRYYPVAIQIPIPPPIPPLPSLAMGIPSPILCIPLPYVWKHIITVTTPIGTIVVWIALAGIVPSPFVMLIDEKGEATFMVSLFGPCSIPHPTVVSPATANIELKALLDLILPPGTIKINLSSPLGKLLAGSTRNDVDNPDSGKNIIDKLKENIKSSFDQLEINDPPSLGGNSPEAIERRRKIKEAFELVPPDAQQIERGLTEVFSIVNAAIDELKIPVIKFPKDDKKLMMPTLGPGEIIDNFQKLLETALAAPAELKKTVLQDIGAAVKVLDVKKTIKERVTQAIDKPSVKEFFRDLDQEISDLENRLSLDVNITAEEKVIERVNAIKKAAKEVLGEVAKEITPEILGFVAKALDVPPLPFPCYTNITLPAVPPYVYLLIAAIKAAPSIIDALSAERIAELVSFELDLSKALPRATPMFYGTINGLLDAIPDLSVPAGLNDNMFKQTIDMVKQIPTKFKVRLPKVGLPTQVVIPPSLIKTLLKEAAQIAIEGLIGLIMGKVYEAIQEGNAAKIIAVSMIIKAMFGVSLSDIKGSDIKNFINGFLESTLYPVLDTISNIIDLVNSLKGNFLSIIELFQFPPKISLPGNDGPFYDVGEFVVKPVVQPIIESVLPILFNNLPAIVTLLACSFTPSRVAFTKLHPTKPVDRLPSWESLSIKNIPFLVWLDQLIGTAQRKGGLGSAYVIPYVSVP